MSPVGGVSGLIRRTSQSLPCGVQAPAGIVTAAKPSADVRFVPETRLVFFSIIGATLADPSFQIVKWIRNGAEWPLASFSSPASVCAPTASAPVP